MTRDEHLAILRKLEQRAYDDFTEYVGGIGDVFNGAAKALDAYRAWRTVLDVLRAIEKGVTR